MNANDILSRHKLKRTSCREGIIEIFLSEKMPLSENEICKHLAGKYDRTTYYRSFKTLVEKNILHKIIIDNRNIKYALNNSNTNNLKHIHFYCNKCKTTECLDSVQYEFPKLPNGYTINESNFIIKGTCYKCNKF